MLKQVPGEFHNGKYVHEALRSSMWLEDRDGRGKERKTLKYVEDMDSLPPPSEKGS